jgi:nickel-dependent lactate racemase
MIPILKHIQEESKKQNVERLEFITSSKYFPTKFKKTLNEYGIQINKIENKDILNKLKDFDKTIIIEKIEFDPFFGYKGPNSELIRSCFLNEMDQAYSNIIDKLPQPGKITEPLDIAIEKSKTIDFESINIIADNDGINSVYIGEAEESFRKTIDKFNTLSKRTVEKAKSAFITGNSNFNIQTNLSNSLNLLWNNFDSVKENGIIILLSESKQGVGNGALLQLIEGRLDPSDQKRPRYIKDLEHINFLNLIKDKFDINIISTVPKTYLNKLGLNPILRIKDGLSTILSKNGKSSKTLIISDSELIKIVQPTA